MTKQGTRLCAMVVAVALAVSTSPTVDAQDASQTPDVVDGDVASIALDHVLRGSAVAPSAAGEEVISIGSDVTSLVDDGRPVEESSLEPTDLAVSDVVENAHNDTTQVYVQQRYDGIDILGALVSVTVADNGEVLYAPGRLVANPESDVDSFGGDTTPTLTATEAAKRAAAALGLAPTDPFRVLDADDDAAQTQTLSDGGVAHGPVSARLVWDVVDDSTLRLAWDFMIDLPSGDHWWQIRIDADNGDELSRYDLVIHEPSLDDQRPAIGPSGNGGSLGDGSGDSIVSVDDGPNDLVADGSSYLVFDGESPDHVTPAGTRTTANQPADDLASPFGWHDTNGVLGAESTMTTGNNVDAGTDIDGNNIIDAGSRPDGGAGLDFAPPLNLANNPTAYRPAVVTNLFYWSNRTHDFLYRYGFDEAAGNFQANNYGRGGVGGDAVSAQAQDDYNNGARNNANFGTPPDGFMPRMQMYVFDAPTPDRDSSFDVGVVAHEYAHGLSNRLTGGPARADCLRNHEQMGEGWSDIIALLMTMKGGTAADRTRGNGTYVLNQLTTGPGVRGTAYSTDLATNPWTYNTIIGTDPRFPHALGAVWAEMLWEMNWALIDVHGFSPDLVGGSGGNNIAAQLIVDGLKIQPCAPGFVDGRNAILQADAINNNGANTCTIWKAFAKRGLGAAAQQGSTGLRTDGTESFAVPAECSIVSLSAPANVAPNETFMYEVHVRNDEATAMPGVVLETLIPTGTTYVPGSAGCNGTLQGSKLVMTIVTVAANASATCSFDVTAAANLGTTVFVDDFTTIANWNRPTGPGTNTWAVRTAIFPEAGEVSASTPSSVSDQYLTLKNPVSISATTQFRLSHLYAMETGFDGGVVEISIDNGTSWQDLGPRFVNGGYPMTIAAGSGNPIEGRMAFSGGPFHMRSTADLGDLAGNSALFRLRLASDNAIGTSPSLAWVLFDAAIGAPDAVLATTTMTVCGGPTTSASARSGVTGATVLGATPAPAALPSAQGRCPISAVPGAPSGIVATAGDASASLAWAPPTATGDAPITGYSVEQSTNAGATWTTATANTATTATAANITGLANGTAIAFRVSAINSFGIGSPSPTSAAVTPSVTVGAVSSLVPQRFVDSRPGGATLDNRFEGDGKRTAGSQYRVQIAGRGNVPVGAKGVVMNVTAIAPEGTGFITVHPCLDPLPVASSLNYTNAVNLGNEIVAPLTASGELCLFTSADAHLTVDVVGFIDAISPTMPVTPTRFLDTRPGAGTFDDIAEGGTKPAAGSTTRMPIAGRGDIPVDAAAVIVNITAIGAEAAGYVTAHACLANPPNTASLNYVAGVNRANELIVNLDDDGQLCLFTFATTHLAADVVGYIPDPSSLTTVAPARLLDTRPGGDTIDDDDQATGKRSAGSTYTLQVTGRAGVPANATAAVIYITAVAPEGVGYVTVHPCSATPPNTASLNYVATVNGGNEIITKLDPSGRICIYTSADTHLTADIVAHLV